MDKGCAPGAANRPSSSASRTILVVDDYEPFRRFVSSLLRHSLKSLIIVEASDGLEAIEKVETQHPDAVLMDIGLPKLDGIQAARRILKLSPESKILFVSQESRADVVKEAMGIGACGYVVKMQAARELLPAVDLALSENPLS